MYKLIARIDRGDFVTEVAIGRDRREPFLEVRTVRRADEEILGRFRVQASCIDELLVAMTEARATAVQHFGAGSTGRTAAWGTWSPRSTTKATTRPADADALEDERVSDASNGGPR